jgi:predicted secreted protein with PEFG-CTERM motif
MKLRRIWLIAFSAVLLISLLVGDSVSAEDGGNSISTEKESYAAGETISVIGSLQTSSDTDVIIQVISPIGNLVDVYQVTPDSEDNFSVDIATSIAGLWKESGTYTIKATHYYGSFQTQFDYGLTMSAQVKPPNTDQELEFSPVDESSDNASVIHLEDYNVYYKITGGKILKIVPDVENTSLIIQIETFSDGELIITLPKEVIDTDEGNFFILVDDEETVYYSQDESDSRTLIIPFYNGSEVIEIIGTFVIPEFGTIAAIILAVAITSIIVLSAKTRLNIMPR